MGIKPLQSLTSDPIFSTNNPLSTNLQQRYYTIPSSDLQNHQLYNPSEIVYKNPNSLTEDYLQRERYQYSTSDEMDNLNQYIFFLKSTTPNMDTTNLHIPHQISIKTRGLCEQTQQVEIFYPFYEYRLRPELEAREARRESFHESEIWYLLVSVLNGMRQFERVKCVSTQFTIDSIRFNSIGCVKIDSAIASPARMQLNRNERVFWSNKNMVNYYAQQTYRLALVLLELCSMISISTAMEQDKKRDRVLRNGNMLYNLQANNTGSAEWEIKRALQVTQQRYSELLFNLLNVMLCHPRDRPLPSQIYQVLSPYKNDILHFKPFNFNPQTMAIIRASLINSNRNTMYNPNTNSQGMTNSSGLGPMQGSLLLDQNSRPVSDNSRGTTNRYKLDSKIYDNQQDNESEVHQLHQVRQASNIGNYGINTSMGRNNKIGGMESRKNNDILVQDFRNQRRNHQTLQAHTNHESNRSKTISNFVGRPNNPINTNLQQDNKIQPPPQPRKYHDSPAQNERNIHNRNMNMQNMNLNNTSLVDSLTLPPPPYTNIGNTNVRGPQPVVYYDREYNRQGQMSRQKRSSMQFQKQKFPSSYLSR